MHRITLPAWVAAVASAAACLPATTAGATPVPPTSASAPATKCHAGYDVVLTPGLSTSPARGTINTARPGTIRCDGPVLGRPVSGPGKIVVISRLGATKPASCLDGGDGWSTLQIRFPTSSGKPVELFEAAQYTFGGLSNGLTRGTFTGDHLDGTFTAIPTKGNCATQPVTDAHVTFEATWHEYRVS